MTNDTKTNHTENVGEIMGLLFSNTKLFDCRGRKSEVSFIASRHHFDYPFPYFPERETELILKATNLYTRDNVLNSLHPLRIPRHLTNSLTWRSFSYGHMGPAPTQNGARQGP